GSRGLGSSCMIEGTARAKPTKTPTFTTIRPTITVRQARNHGNLSFRCSQLAAGHKMTASKAEMVTGMKIDWPRYRATAAPSKARMFSPMRVADERLRSICPRVLAGGEPGRYLGSSHHRRTQRVVQQHGDRHRPDAFGHGRKPAGHGGHACFV